MSSFLARAAVALLIATLASVGLYLLLRERTATIRVDPAAPERPPYLALPSNLPRGRTWLCYLASADRPLPDRVAPVVRISAGGAVVVDRPAPPPDGPIAGAWLGVGIVLPAPTLGELSPTERAVFLALWRAWSGDGVADLDRAAVPWGVSVDDGELVRLARWIR